MPKPLRIHTTIAAAIRPAPPHPTPPHPTPPFPPLQGLTRGNARITNFMEVVNNNLDALIKWKNRRIPFDDAAAAR